MRAWQKFLQEGSRRASDTQYFDAAITGITAATTGAAAGMSYATITYKDPQKYAIQGAALFTLATITRPITVASAAITLAYINSADVKNDGLFAEDKEQFWQEYFPSKRAHNKNNTEDKGRG